MTEDERYVAYRDAIRRRVCAPCLDGRGDGFCGLTGHTCAIEAHLPDIVETVMAVDSDRMVDYVVAIEARVCGKCEQRGPSGECRLRDSGDCALAAYLSLVVDAVEEVRGRARQDA
jgi:hypothetical protein